MPNHYRSTPFLCSEAGASWRDYEGRLKENREYKRQYAVWNKGGRIMGEFAIAPIETGFDKRCYNRTRNPFVQTDEGSKWKDYQGNLQGNKEYQKEYQDWRESICKEAYKPRGKGREGPFFKSEIGSKYKDRPEKHVIDIKGFKADFAFWRKCETAKLNGTPAPIRREKKYRSSDDCHPFYKTELGFKWKKLYHEKRLWTKKIEHSLEYRAFTNNGITTQEEFDFFESMKKSRSEFLYKPELWTDDDNIFSSPKGWKTSTFKEEEKDSDHKKRLYQRQKYRQNTKIECECGKKISKGNIKVHRFSVFHTRYIESKEEEEESQSEEEEE